MCFDTGTCSIVTRNYLAEVKKTTQSLWISLFGVIFSTIPMLLIEQQKLPDSINGWVYLWVHSVSVSVLNMVSIVSISHLGPLVVSVLLPLYLVVMYVLQVTWLNPLHPGHQNAEEIIGVVLVLVVAMVMPLIKMDSKQTDSEEEDAHLLNSSQDQAHSTQD